MDTRITPFTQDDDESKYQELLDETARKAAYDIGPRVYHLTGIEPGPVRFFVLGCHGNGGNTQKETAELMNVIAKDLRDSEEPMPSFILFLGDNMYDYGVPSPSAAGFSDCFHKIYYNPEMTVIHSIPSFLLLGNHDDNLHGKAFLSANASGDETGINQAAHTFIANTPDNIKKRAALYKQNALPIDKLSHWNMPYLYYSIVAGNTQIFCLNSNTYLQDYLDLASGKVKTRFNKDGSMDVVNLKTGLINQAWWFQKEYATARLAGRQIFVAQHHPLSVSGKRSFPTGFDYNHYLSWQQVLDLNENLKCENSKFVETASYNTLLAAVFNQQGIDPDMVFVAHEHFISWHHEVNQQTGQQKLRQFTSGGGGGDLQKRTSYRNNDAIPMHQQHNGFGMVTCYPAHPKEFALDVFTVEGLHLRFNDSNQKSIMKISDDPQVEKVRQCVLNACYRYFNMLKEAELRAFPVENILREKSLKTVSTFYSLFQKATDVCRSVYDTTSNIFDHIFHDTEAAKENRLIQDLQAYFSQVKLPDYQAVIERLFSLSQQLPYRLHESDQAFYAMLQNEIRLKHRVELSEIFRNAGLQVDTSVENESSHPVRRIH